MRFHRYALRFVLCAGLPLAACERASREGSEAARADLPARPQTKQVAIGIEGTPQSMDAKLFRSPDSFDVPFSTYVPSDMAPETLPGEEDAVRFVAEFGGQRNEQAFLHVFFHPRGTDRERADALARGFASSRGVPMSEESEAQEPRQEEGIPPEESTPGPRRFAWSLMESRYENQCEGTARNCSQGYIALGEHRGRFFHIVVQHPPEYADGFGPRAHLILQEWRWEDTGGGLGQ